LYTSVAEGGYLYPVFGTKTALIPTFSPQGTQTLVRIPGSQGVSSDSESLPKISPSPIRNTGSLRETFLPFLLLVLKIGDRK